MFIVSFGIVSVNVLSIDLLMRWDNRLQRDVSWRELVGEGDRCVLV